MEMGSLVIVSAISGAGKTTLVHEAVRRLKENGNTFDQIVTYTTRLIRTGEKNGIDYHFISRELFLEKQQNNFFFETEIFNNHFYGMSYDFIDDLNRGRSFIVILTRDGAKKIHKEFPSAKMVWIMAPSLEVIRERLIKRGDESFVAIEKRIELSKPELEEEHKHRLYSYHLVNDSFDQAVRELCRIILE